MISRIHKGRFSFVVFTLIFATWLALSGKWSIIAKLPWNLSGHIHTADYDAYAKSIGTTRYKIAQKFYAEQVEQNRIKRARGVSNCSPLRSSGKDCIMPPLRGLPSIERNVDFVDIAEGARRAAVDLKPLLLPMFVSILLSLFLVFLMPMMARNFWLWLTPKHKN